MIRDEEIRTCECGADYVFVTVGNQEGRPAGPMPVNAGPDPDGNVAVYRTATERLVGRVIGKSSVSPHETLFMPHAATCPDEARRRQQRAEVRRAQSAHAAQQRNRRGYTPRAQQQLPRPAGYRLPPPRGGGR